MSVNKKIILIRIKLKNEDWISPSTKIRQSGIEGKGLHAIKPIKKGDLVVVWGGIYVGFEEAEKAKQDGKLVMQWDDNLFSIEDRGEGLGYFVNHSCKPNLEMKGAYALVAVRDIKKGEELTADYALWEADENYISKWKCNCGSSWCRKRVTGKDWRKPELQEKYKGHFSPLISKRIKALNVKKTVKESYAKIAQSSGSCGCSSCGCDSNQTVQKQSGQMGYSQDEMSQVPTGSNLGLGCGNPVAIASLKEGEVVLDLGSGAGFDAFLASPKVGRTGKVIGVDMTDEMLNKARENAKKGNYANVEFRKGDIENLPVNDNSVDVIISNCVINLAPDKEKVFREAYRVLKTGGRLMISDIVLMKSLPEKLKNDKELLVGCVSGAILKQDYLNLLEKAGFSNITIHKETPAFLEDYGLSLVFSAFKQV